MSAAAMGFTPSPGGEHSEKVAYKVYIRAFLVFLQNLYNFERSTTSTTQHRARANTAQNSNTYYEARWRSNHQKGKTKEHGART